MSTNQSTQILDELLAMLDSKLSQASMASNSGRNETAEDHHDAIEAVLVEGPRQTAVMNLRESPVVEQFRQALVDGLIRTDTVNQLLKLVNEIVVRLVP